MQIYVPRIPGVSNEFAYLPDQFAFTYEDVWLTAADGIKLHAWFMWPREWAQDVLATKPTVLFLQACVHAGHTRHAYQSIYQLAEGVNSCQRRPLAQLVPSHRLIVRLQPQENAGNMSWRLPFLRMLSRYLDCSVLALRYT